MLFSAGWNHTYKAFQHVPFLSAFFKVVSYPSCDFHLHLSCLYFAFILPLVFSPCESLLCYPREKMYLGFWSPVRLLPFFSAFYPNTLSKCNVFPVLISSSLQKLPLSFVSCSATYICLLLSSKSSNPAFSPYSAPPFPFGLLPVILVICVSQSMLACLLLDTRHTFGCK
ncbi:hypothetical protein DFH11DRAFT_863702 [Phellopilus nigrolimitatus]|nr:hypothetical protein DFH11DRAFT_863702 [Phellopilus nigrolimitatus]